MSSHGSHTGSGSRSGVGAAPTSAGFAGETEVITKTGVTTIRALAGATHPVLSNGGVWVDATVSGLGRREICEVVLIRSGVRKTIRAAPQHPWFVRTRRSRVYPSPTIDLRGGDIMQSVFAARPDGVTVDASSAARGFVFGDGTRPRGRTKSIALFAGEKDKALLPLFEGIGNAPRAYTGLIKISGLPGAWKSHRPDLDQHQSVLYGWLAGYFAADGDVGKTGRPTICSAVFENLEYVRTLCRLIGVGTFGIRTRSAITPYSRGEKAMMYLMGLMRADLDPSFFLIPDHRERFISGMHAAERRSWRVESMRLAGDQADVYCPAVSPQHAFALQDDLLVGDAEVSS